MARTDIEVDPVYGEVETTDNLRGKAVYPFALLEDFQGPYGNDVLYGEISLPAEFDQHYTWPYW